MDRRVPLVRLNVHPQSNIHIRHFRMIEPREDAEKVYDYRSNRV